MGYVIGKKTITSTLTTGAMAAPIASPCCEQMACGIICKVVTSFVLETEIKSHISWRLYKKIGYNVSDSRKTEEK